MISQQIDSKEHGRYRERQQSTFHEYILCERGVHVRHRPPAVPRFRVAIPGCLPPARGAPAYYLHDIATPGATTAPTGRMISRAKISPQDHRGVLRPPSLQSMWTATRSTAAGSCLRSGLAAGAVYGPQQHQPRLISLKCSNVDMICCLKARILKSRPVCR